MRFFGILFFVFSFLLVSFAAQASDRTFFAGIQGKWRGPGEIVAGKFKGTRFVCTFDGESLKNLSGMNIGGSCRIGLFSQPMNALVRKAGGRYKGKFLDGAAGEGMDVIGGRYSKSRLSVDIVRKDLRGVMITSLNKKKQLNVTVSVHVGKRLIPVIGMTLNRVGSKKMASKIK
ncbi:MAG: hypothetical protein JKX91_03880 [Rhizobiaceae bacterium]|nr:hypothetical protein [Rhizobiaceae bacterium]